MAELIDILRPLSSGERVMAQGGLGAMGGGLGMGIADGSDGVVPGAVSYGVANALGEAARQYANKQLAPDSPLAFQLLPPALQMGIALGGGARLYSLLHSKDERMRGIKSAAPKPAMPAMPKLTAPKVPAAAPAAVAPTLPPLAAPPSMAVPPMRVAFPEAPRTGPGPSPAGPRPAKYDGIYNAREGYTGWKGWNPDTDLSKFTPGGPVAKGVMTARGKDWVTGDLAASAAGPGIGRLPSWMRVDPRSGEAAIRSPGMAGIGERLGDGLRNTRSWMGAHKPALVAGGVGLGGLGSYAGYLNAQSNPRFTDPGQAFNWHKSQLQGMQAPLLEQLQTAARTGDTAGMQAIQRKLESGDYGRGSFLGRNLFGSSMNDAAHHQRQMGGMRDAFIQQQIDNASGTSNLPFLQAQASTLHHLINSGGLSPQMTETYQKQLADLMPQLDPQALKAKQQAAHQHAMDLAIGNGMFPGLRPPQPPAPTLPDLPAGPWSPAYLANRNAGPQG